MMKFPIAAITLLSLALPCQGAWLLLDDFEAGNSFNGGSTVVDPTNGSNTVFSHAAGTQVYTKALSALEMAPDGQTSTLFYQVFVPNGNVADTHAGLKDNTGTNWGSYVSQVGFNDGGGALNVQVRLGNESGGGMAENQHAPYVLGAYYDVWQVIDLTANRYDVHLSGPSTAGQIQIADDFTFRNTGDPGDLNSIMLRSGGSNTGIYFDNFYMSQGAVDLSNPVPEPSAFALLSLAGLGLTLRRRK